MGAGLAGVPTLSLATLLALGAIVAGALSAERALRPAGTAPGHAHPAE